MFLSSGGKKKRAELCVIQLVECQHPALCEECSRFRKITRGEWLRAELVFCYHRLISAYSRLGGTAAVTRPPVLEQTRK